MLGPTLVAFYIGVRWHAITNKYEQSTQKVLTILFGLHYIIMVFFIRTSFLASMLSNLFLLFGVYFGNKFQVMGITGGISTGKSTVSNILANAGFAVIDSDKISKEVSNDPKTINQIKKEFGEEVFDDKGELDRIKLGEIVFKSKTKRKKLNSIMQGKIFWKMIKEFWRLRFTENQSSIILDVPLLYETKILEYICYPILVVAVDDEEKIKKRLMARNQLTEEQALDRIRAQMPLKLKCEKADIIVNNSGNFSDLQNELKDNTMKQIIKCLSSPAS
ncbi:unnamed protein product [Moneuplotes crassus]|uniref:Dephospho-CoA kinase n=1 Tax=Euplotes crassus TaxID=5936 RepID=A0AAD1XRJ3_EUPCR|nr:unnamed protein product [Moneuplotes crassus]